MARAPSVKSVKPLPALVLMAGAVGGIIAGRLGRRRPYVLRDRVVLVTGGSRGLGLALAREFGRRGARVAICARDVSTLERARHDLADRGIHVVALAEDVGDPARVDAAVAGVRERLGPVDVLVNNAGVIQVGPMETMTREDYEQAMRTNFLAAVYTTSAVLRDMRATGRGRIVNICSIGGKVAVPHLLPYTASKFALAGFSEGLRAELAKDGIVVTTIYPGLMRTGSPRHARFKGRHRAEYAWFNISDSLPGLAMDVDRAARRVIDACVRGDRHVVLSVPAKLVVALHALFPGITGDLLAVANRLLPEPGGIGREQAAGHESESGLSPSWLTVFGERAARKYNQTA
jgi:NAD(P)-dependent dehydrogenase (short-subunit alcohol dehydrogenase family)